MIYSIEEIRENIKTVADNFDIEEIRLFGSYFDGQPTEDSDLDFVVKYGSGCRGLKRIGFMLALEEKFGKEIDVISIDFMPDFMSEIDIHNEERMIYEKQKCS